MSTTNPRLPKTITAIVIVPGDNAKPEVLRQSGNPADVQRWLADTLEDRQVADEHVIVLGGPILPFRVHRGVTVEIGAKPEASSAAPERKRERSPDTGCAIEGCTARRRKNGRIEGVGFCSGHYDQVKAQQAIDAQTVKAAVATLGLKLRGKQATDTAAPAEAA